MGWDHHICVHKGELVLCIMRVVKGAYKKHHLSCLAWHHTHLRTVPARAMSGINACRHALACEAM